MSYSAYSQAFIYGLHGQFSIGKDNRDLKAIYVETKIKPGSSGEWSNILASHVVPWRETFPIEKVSFDELLQRDLNDSRVANDLIPYLIGDNGKSARFFPPILAVLVPKNETNTGIEKHYPNLEVEGSKQKYGNIFDFEITQENGQDTPWGKIGFNPQKASFVIVDGQHRAMAILALHRQINKSWGDNKYQSYYSHLEISPSDVQNLELPVCIVYFPDLVEGNADLIDKGLSLDIACRELFVVVNRQAQSVSYARELLLDDDDIAAHLMRRTLSKFKGRTEQDDTLSRIYSYKYGDSDDQGKNVVTGQLEYCSAVALHKMHSIASFGNPDGFNMIGTCELTDGRYRRNPARPVSIIHGVHDKWQNLSRRSGRVHSPKDIKKAVELLGDLTDYAIIKIFDEFWPFSVHNSLMRQERRRLQDPLIKSDPIQNKCQTLLFEGSGVRSVFEEHIERLTNLKQEIEDEGAPVSNYIINQLTDSKAIIQSLTTIESRIKTKRYCEVFNLNHEKFYGESAEKSQDELNEVEEKGASIYNTIATQAFQIGYLVAICTLTEESISEDAEYSERLAIFKLSTDIVISCLNNYFRPKQKSKHDVLTGIIKEQKIDVFNNKKNGLRALLSLQVNELNERQWQFFRYSLFEIMFSKHNKDHLKHLLTQIENEEMRNKINSSLIELCKSTKELRKSYISRGVERAIKGDSFQREIQTLQARLEGAKEGVDEIQKQIAALEKTERDKIANIANEYLKASTGTLNSLDKTIEELSKASA